MWTDCVRLNARRHPDRMAVVDDTARLTHRQLGERARAIARGLCAGGLRPGDHVGILAGNSVFCIEAFLGAISASGVTSSSTTWDEEVRAVVALRPGHDASATELGEFVRRYLAGYKIPKMFVFMRPGVIPVNASGKIVKSNLRLLVGW